MYRGAGRAWGSVARDVIYGGCSPDGPLNDMLPFAMAIQKSWPDDSIRDALPADVPVLTSLLGELGFPAEAESVARRLAMLVNREETVLVAVRGGEVVGFVSLHKTPVLHRPKLVGRLTALVVAQRARRHGVGSALVAAAEQRLMAAGCGMVELTSNLELREAHAFYERLGYSITSYRFCRKFD